jgi:methylated-DNA-protein-cysteine methyltransferase-like protein
VESGPFAAVWRHVARIPRGRVSTYGELSALVGRRLTPVGIGWALRAAAPGAIPWHRVVAAGGRIATEREQPGVQRELLEAEGVAFDSSGAVDLGRHAWRGRERVTAHARGGRRRRNPA